MPRSVAVRKKGALALWALLDLTLLRGRDAEQYRRLKHQRDWIIESDSCFEPADEQGQRRTVCQVKQAVADFLEHLTREAVEQPGEAKVIAHIAKAVRYRRFGLFTCY
jgi:hypothetical protein